MRYVTVISWTFPRRSALLIICQLYHFIQIISIHALIQRDEEKAIEERADLLEIHAAAAVYETPL